MSSEHVEVLREMLDDAAIEPPWEPEEVAAITAAIAALSAPQPEGEWVLVPREPSEAMLSAAHYELADKPFSNNAERSERAYAAMLAAAPQPPAEAQPVAWQFQDREGNWHEFIDEQHRLNTIEDGSWPIRALYAHPPPSAPVGVEGHYHPCTSILIEGLKRLEGGSDVLEEWDRARVKVDTALAQQPAAVDGVPAALRDHFVEST